MPVKAPAAPAPFYDWTGFYVGGHVANSVGRANSTLSDPEPTASTNPFNSQYGGLQAGYNYVLPSRLLLGIETDITFPQFFENGGIFTGGTAQGTTVTDQIDYIATLRGRFGYAFDHWMIYGTGGFAWSQARFGETPGVGSDEDKILLTRTGWALGLGAELAIAPGWTARVEYLYDRFGTVAGVFPSGTGYQSAFDIQALRLGLDRKLGWADADMAANGSSDPWPIASDRWNVHGQFTFVEQGYPAFHSPYQGQNSLSGASQAKDTASATAFIGFRPWDGTDIYINPEITQGFGLSDTLGVAGFPNFEAQKASFPMPRFDLARVYVQQTFGLGGEQETIEDGPNQIARKEDISRLTIIAGKLAVTDFFDNNAYAHDGRTQFFNWNVDCCGSYDWTMDQISYTWGAMAELNQKFWAVRAGYFLVPAVSNTDDFDMRFPDGEYIGELELRYSLVSQPGKLRLMAWANRANMGSYAAALAEPITTPNYPDITLRAPGANQLRLRGQSRAGDQRRSRRVLARKLESRSRRNHRLDRLRRKPFRRRRAEGDVLGTPQRQNRRGRRHRGPLARGAGLFCRRRARNIDRRWRAQLPTGEDPRDLLLLQPQHVVESHFRLSVRRRPRL